VRRALRRHAHKAHRRFSELWLARDVPAPARWLLGRWASRHGLASRAFDVCAAP